MLEYSGSVPMHERFIDALIYTTVQAEEKKAPIFIKATKFILKPNNMEAALRVWNKKKTQYKKFKVIFNNPNKSIYGFQPYNKMCKSMYYNEKYYLMS